MSFMKLFTFTLFTFVSHAFKNTHRLLNNKLISSTTLFNQNNINDFIYIISHHYECDDYFYASYCDLHRVYKTEKEAFLHLFTF